MRNNRFCSCGLCCCCYCIQGEKSKGCNVFPCNRVWQYATAGWLGGCGGTTRLFDTTFIFFGGCRITDIIKTLPRWLGQCGITNMLETALSKESIVSGRQKVKGCIPRQSQATQKCPYLRRQRRVVLSHE
jgi:hypothetical protein